MEYFDFTRIQVQPNLESIAKVVKLQRYINFVFNSANLQDFAATYISTVMCSYYNH